MLQDSLWNTPHIKIYVRDNDSAWGIKLYELERMLHLKDENDSRMTEFMGLFNQPCYIKPVDITCITVWQEEAIKISLSQTEWEKNNAITEG